VSPRLDTLVVFRAPLVEHEVRPSSSSSSSFFFVVFVVFVVALVVVFVVVVGGAATRAAPGWPWQDRRWFRWHTHCGGRYATAGGRRGRRSIPGRDNTTTTDRPTASGGPASSFRRSPTARLAVVRRLRWRGGDDAP
jgi:hypothetical protein